MSSLISSTSVCVTITVVTIVGHWLGRDKANGKTTNAFRVLELKANVRFKSTGKLNIFPEKLPIKGAKIIKHM